MTDEKSQDNEARIKAHRRKRNATAALGAGILVLALAGFCFIMFFAVKAGVAYIKNFVGLEEDEAYFEKYLEPVVMFDPKPLMIYLKQTRSGRLKRQSGLRSTRMKRTAPMRPLRTVERYSLLRMWRPI